MIIVYRIYGAIICAIIFALLFYSNVSFASADTNEEMNLNEATTTTQLVSAEATPPLKIEAIASTPSPVGDYVVGPGKTEVQVFPGQTITRYITVANRIADGRTFSLEVEDMSGTADGSENVVLLGDKNGPYSLRDYISFPTTEFTLDLNTKAVVPVVISIPPDAEPGGYYGAVLVTTQEKVSETDVPAPRSPMIARVGSLFFITVPGETEVRGELVNASTANNKMWYQSGPIDFSIVFENKGSVHLNPYGEVRVKNLFGEEVGFVELDPWFVLPKSLRLRTMTWDRELLLGRYTFTVKVNRGYDNMIDERSFAIWVLPWKMLGGLFLGLFIILFGIRFFFKTFEFKRKV